MRALVSKDRTAALAALFRAIASGTEHGARTSDRDGRGKTVIQQARGAVFPFLAQLAT
jgi:hypothetical protein